MWLPAPFHAQRSWAVSVIRFHLCTLSGQPVNSKYNLMWAPRRLWNGDGEIPLKACQKDDFSSLRSWTDRVVNCCATSFRLRNYATCCSPHAVIVTRFAAALQQIPVTGCFGREPLALF